MKIGSLVLLLMGTMAVGPVAGTAMGADNPKVTLETSKGTIVIELYPNDAPKTVANFLQYARWGHYDGTIFHRVIPDFMIQGGGFDEKLNRKLTELPIENEADNGLKNERGTVAMARTPDPNSATDQFFINTKNNMFLNHKNETSEGWGYAVFGKVIQGMAVVDEISKVKTGEKGAMSDVPVEPVVIEKVSVQ